MAEQKPPATATPKAPAPAVVAAKPALGNTTAARNSAEADGEGDSKIKELQKPKKKFPRARMSNDSANKESDDDTDSKKSSEKAKANVTLTIPKLFQFEKEFLQRPVITTLAQNEVAELKGSFPNPFVKKLEWRLVDLEQQMKSGKISEFAIDQHLRYYLKRQNIERFRYQLQALIAICLALARASNNKEFQIQVLFKAIDLLRLYIQYTDEGINILASSIIVHIFSVLPKSFDEKWEIEKEIFQTFFELHKTQRKFTQQGFGKRDDVSLRIKIARLYSKQKNYYDSYVQFGKILDIFKYRPADDPEVILGKAHTLSWMGNVVQDIIHNAQAGKTTILLNFIYRYNRDHFNNSKAVQITVPKGQNEKDLIATKHDLIRVANSSFQALERMGTELDSVGYKVTNMLIEAFVVEKFRPHLVKALKEMRGRIFNSRTEFSQELAKIANPAPNQAQNEKIWHYLSADAENVNQFAKLQLKYNIKWLEVYHSAMMQLAKNYEFLKMGDEAFTYAKHAYYVIKPMKEKEYLATKLTTLSYIQSLTSNKQLKFVKYSTRHIQNDIMEVTTELNKLNEQKERMNRDRHIRLSSTR